MLCSNLRRTIGLSLMMTLCGITSQAQAQSQSAPASSHAQDFPSRQVRLIVPFPPGGATDALARLMADKLTEKWKQSVIVENRPGANTMLGTDVVAKSAPDGHTLGIVTGSQVTNPLLTSKMPYDTFKDTTGVTIMTRYHMALYAHPSLAANTPSELIALAKKEKVAYASATTQSYLAMELFNEMAGIKLDYVPYKGSSQAITDLIGGHVKLMIDPILESSLEQAKMGKLKLIATMGSVRSELTPNTPAIGEVVRGYDFTGVFGLIARNGTPPALLHRIRDDLVAVMKMPEVAERIRSIGQEPVGAQPEEYDAYLRAETKKWEPVVKSTGARLD